MQKFDPRRRMGEREKDQVVSLLFAAKAGDLNTVRRMYMQGCDLEMSDYDKRTALHLAASEGHLDIIMFLVNTAKMESYPIARRERRSHDEDSGTEATPDQHFVPIHSPFAPHTRDRSNSNSSTAPIEAVLNTPTPDSISQKFVPYLASPLANHSCTTGSVQSASVSSSDSESSSSDDDVERHAQVPSPGHSPDQTEISAEQTRNEVEQTVNNGDSAYSSPTVQPVQDKNPGLVTNGSNHGNELHLKIPDESHRKPTTQSQVAQKNFANMHRRAQQQHQLRVKLANSPKQ
ncbi:ankyrin repeats (3 copies) domain-containing protein [Ditylenchus destructor]|nr:ankyrin repeats (3 copies) domain-containing protein [Ditylenchus destructor]